MATVNVTIRMEENVKKEADSLFNDLGMNITTAINIFVKQALRERKIPFEISLTRNIDYPGISDVDKIFDEEYTKHAAVYKELAK